MTRAMSIFRPPESRAKVKLENTYQLGPQNGSVFSPEKVKDVIEQVLQEYLDDTKYSARECKDLSKDISTDISTESRSLNLIGIKSFVMLSLDSVMIKASRWQVVRSGSIRLITGRAQLTGIPLCLHWRLSMAFIMNSTYKSY